MQLNKNSLEEVKSDFVGNPIISVWKNYNETKIQKIHNYTHTYISTITNMRREGGKTGERWVLVHNSV